MTKPRASLLCFIPALLLAMGCQQPRLHPHADGSPAMSNLFDWNQQPDLVVRMDSFILPESAREEFTAAMHRNLAFIRTLEGFRGHRVFEKRAGDSAYNIVTLAAWENPAALEKAGKEVRAHYQRMGFDMPANLKRWGVQLVRADYGTPPALQ